MTASHASRRYTITFAIVCTVVLLPVVVLNFLLGLRSLGDGDAVAAASRWQQATRGVTYAPPLSANRPFKSARLFDRLPEINTVILGSSTMMGITQEMFPDEQKIYNFAQTGNLLSTVIGEAEYLQQSSPQSLKWFFIAFDWALGSPYFPGDAVSQNLAPAAAGTSSGPGLSVAQRLADALSLPRVKNLVGIVAGVARAPQPVSAFRELFLQAAGEPYQCSDGTPARDFDTIFRGTCTGFRFDGSATFGNLEPLSPQRAQTLIASAVVPSSKYAVELIKARGEPNPQLLLRLAALARAIRAAGGGVVLVLPPLLPGMEHALQASVHTAAPLQRTRALLEQWGRSENVTIIDAGASERFGCSVAEFVDEHHALPACYAKIFARFRAARSGRNAIPAGLWSGQG
jgi:hypothetical protein